MSLYIRFPNMSSGGGGSGVTTIGTIDSVSPSANGGVISGTSLVFQSASATLPGLVNTLTQSFAGNKTFTGTLAASNLSGTNTGNVTLSTANGLSLVGQALSLGLSSVSTTGALSSVDWATFNGKQDALTIGNISDAGTDGIVITGGVGAIIGAGVALSQHVSDSTHNGYLSSADWNVFSAKQAAGNYITALTTDVVASGPGSVAATIQANVVSNSKLAQMTAHTVKANVTGSTANASDVALGTVTESTSSVLTLTGWSDATIGSPTIQVAQATISTSGYLSSTDWNTFNNKQSTLTLGNLTDAGTDGITVTGGTGAVVGSGTSIAQHVADSTHNGYLSSADWSSFTAKGSVSSVTFTGDGVVLSNTPSSAVTTTGTLTATLNTQTANQIFAGPASGSAAAPTFRAQVPLDRLLNTFSPGNGYTVVATDDVLYCGAGAITVNLPSAAVNGRVLYFYKYDMPLANIITIQPQGGETIGNSANTTLNTFAECIQVVSDGGTNWNILNRAIPSPYQTFTMVITGTTSNPTKGTATLDNAIWKRTGDSVRVMYTFQQSGAGTAGSGTYLFGLPPGLSIDTTKYPISTSDPNITAVGSGQVIANTNGNSAVATIALYDATHVQINLPSSTTGDSAAVQVDSTHFDLSNGSVVYTFSYEVPIAGWAS